MKILLTGASGYVGSHALTILTGAGTPSSHPVTGAPCDSADRLATAGSGEQHWATIYAADLADLFRRNIENNNAAGHFIAPSGNNPTVRELTEAAARAAGALGVVTETDEAARARRGTWPTLSCWDQQADAKRARSVLSWSPRRPTLLDELGNAGYSHR